MNANFKPLQEQIAEKLIAALKDGTSPFQKPWTDDNSAGYITPLNPTTDKNYRGMNALWLAMQGFEDPRWMTLKQASFNKWSVEKGAKATMINFIKKTDIRPILDEKGEPALKEDGKPKTEVVKLDKPIYVNAFVFNAEQIKGIPEWERALTEKQALQQWTPIERAEQIVAASEAHIKHGGNEAYYTPSKDFIQLPKKEQFESATKYYATLLHELGHWSGNENRLKRDLSGKFGTSDYAKEELRAEIASLMIGSEINIGHNFGQHAAYVENWIKVLQDDPSELFKASADAQKITDYIMAFEQKVERAQQFDNNIVNPEKLSAGEVISYNEKEYKVLAELKNNVIQMEESTGRKFKISPKDGVYTSLLEARNNPIEQAVNQENTIVQQDLAEQQNETTYKLER
ncbi:ArdC family protein [Mucilaginibacter sp. X5P1]|uniref:ArdC family protein n=1 Tax=Mucilaginibacter sp. X5P1 TaxID=2723088 RepID=UPI001612CAC6|nr:zincin-like metallopeptidase domain-containing protein [Mucilaginibacter sp. X5P1]MBB6141704.1 antirestriction protein ArdC [Mucilaginibacter sp. X5P1]